jgi:membrane associated rhomboid family serine protease
MNRINPELLTATNALIASNVILFFLMQGLGLNLSQNFALYPLEHDAFKPWQLISYMFLHGGLTHVLFNMIALWSFGTILERVWGVRRFLFFYLVCGVGAGVIHLLVTQYQFNQLAEQLSLAGFSARDLNALLDTGRYSTAQLGEVSKETLAKFYYLHNSPTVGASGATYGLLTAFALLFPHFKIMLIFLPVPVKAMYFVPVLLLIDLLAGVTGFSIFGANIAHFAHIGGGIVGLALVFYWLKKAQNQA